MVRAKSAPRGRSLNKVARKLNTAKPVRSPTKKIKKQVGGSKKLQDNTKPSSPRKRLTPAKLKKRRTRLDKRYTKQINSERKKSEQGQSAIPRAHVIRIIKEAVAKHAKESMRFTKHSVETLHTIAEKFLVEQFQSASLLTKLRGNIQTNPEDLRVALALTHPNLAIQLAQQLNKDRDETADSEALEPSSEVDPTTTNTSQPGGDDHILVTSPTEDGVEVAEEVSSDE